MTIPEMAEVISTTDRVKPLSRISVDRFERRNPRNIPGINTTIALTSPSPKRPMMVRAIREIMGRR
jgi:hypothetical protein